MSNIYEKLELLQQQFKAPKTEWNDHSKFKYRTLHVVATVNLVNLEDLKEIITVRASAQEAAVQKGMQAAQISGSTSSYARKYALAALLLIDDTDEIDQKEGDQSDWDSEIKSAKDITKLMKIFSKMDSESKKEYTPLLTERKRELSEVDNADIS